MVVDAASLTPEPSRKCAHTHCAAIPVIPALACAALESAPPLAATLPPRFVCPPSPSVCCPVKAFTSRTDNSNNVSLSVLGLSCTISARVSLNHPADSPSSHRLDEGTPPPSPAPPCVHNQTWTPAYLPLHRWHHPSCVSLPGLARMLFIPLRPLPNASVPPPSSSCLSPYPIPQTLDPKP